MITNTGVIVALVKNTQSIQGDRRKQPRQRVLWGARVTHLDGGYSVKCETRNISPSVARIHLDDNLFPLLVSMYLLDMQNRLAYQGKIIWRKLPEVGLQFLRAYRFDEIPSRGVRQIIDDQYRVAGDWLA
jgi:hypothetical protein